MSIAYKEFDCCECCRAMPLCDEMHYSAECMHAGPGIVVHRCSCPAGAIEPMFRNQHEPGRHPIVTQTAGIAVRTASAGPPAYGRRARAQHSTLR